MIDSYSFGRMEIGGKIYTSDLIIFPDRIDASWWRKTGHRLCLDDLHKVLDEKFEVLVIGTGFSGLMKVDKEVIHQCDSLGCDLFIENTQKAIDVYNAVCSQRKTVAAFHLTC